MKTARYSGQIRPFQSLSVTAIALSVTCGDSSPRGRAKEGEPRRESQGGRAKEGEVAEHSEDGEGMPLPLGEVAEGSEDGEGEGEPSVRGLKNLPCTFTLNPL